MTPGAEPQRLDRAYRLARPDEAQTHDAHILVVEDEVIVALDIKQSLERLGYHVVDTVTSGDAALAVAAEARVDLVLMDIHLDGSMDGIEAAGLLRARHDTPVVYLTAYADDETLKRARITEPFGYAIKPYEERELKSAIEIGLYKHRMDRRLRESEHRLHSVLRSIDDAVLVIDNDHDLSFVNETARTLLRGDGDRMPFEIVDVLRIPAGSRRVEAPTWPADRPMTFDGHLHIGGPVVPIEGTFSAVRDENGTSLGWVVVLRDVTARLRAADAERRLASIVTSSGDAIVSVDPDGRVATWNPSAERLFGYTAREARGCPIDELLFAGAERTAAELVAHVHEGRPYAVKETSAGHRQGGTCHVSVDVSPMRDPSGRVTGASLIMHDLARRKALEAEVAALRRRMAERARQLV